MPTSCSQRSDLFISERALTFRRIVVIPHGFEIFVGLDPNGSLGTHRDVFALPVEELSPAVVKRTGR